MAFDRLLKLRRRLLDVYWPSAYGVYLRCVCCGLAPSKVRVNAIAPSISQSAMAAPILSKEEVAAKLGKEHPLGRVGEAEDSAALAHFLLSNDASWVTGQIIGVDGGRSAVA